jgi:nucleoside-diphosphate-sugar epimerase
MNIASGKPTSILELFSIIREKTRYSKEPIFMENRKGDVDYSLANISKAKELLNFYSKYSLENGLEKTIHSLKA